ncbi:MAG: amidohydrolase [Micavibrio sp.]|nr:amidohydrolase [Micavibrio sp.]
MGIIKKIQDMKQEMTRWRQKMHAEPELAFEERWTARFITRQLQDFGIDVHALTKTGVVGVLHGKNGPGGKAIMLRADMDGLPVDEKTGVTHASRNPGVMHACGHDGHMAMLLGAAKHLAASKDFDGTVYFVFQPAEEAIGGAAEMIKQGLFTQFPADEVYGLHNYPGLPLGMLATGSGAMLAASEDFQITIRGKGGHASHSEQTTDVIGAAAEAVMAFKEIAKKEIPAGEPAALSITTLQTSGEAINAFPDSASITGTIRSFDEKLHQVLIDKMVDVVDTIEAKYGVTVDFDLKTGYPVLVNDKKATDFAIDVAKDTVGDAQVLTSVPKTLGTEDFAYYLQKKPGNYMAIGTGKAGEKNYTDIHSAKYDFNDAALPIGASYWVNLVEKALPVLNGPVTPAPGQNPAGPAPKM